MADILTELYEIVDRRKAEHEEGSYTAYLFDEGLDKILKKLGEETAETIIAAKNLQTATERSDGFLPPAEGTTERENLVNEVGDLLYHLIVMLNELGIPSDEIETLLRSRMQKTGNLKK